MSNSSAIGRRNGFTLLELLVVIAIIMGLVGLLIPGMRAVLRAAEKANAARTVDGLLNAFRTYNQERSAWPTQLSSGQTDAAVVGFLTGQDPVLGPNRVRYMELLPKHLNASGQLADP